MGSFESSHSNWSGSLASQHYSNVLMIILTLQKRVSIIIDFWLTWKQFITTYCVHVERLLYCYHLSNFFGLHKIVDNWKLVDFTIKLFLTRSAHRSNYRVSQMNWLTHYRNKSNKLLNIYLKILVCGIIWCGESIACIFEAWKNLLDPDSGNFRFNIYQYITIFYDSEAK